MKYKYNASNLDTICKESMSYRQVLIYLNLIPMGGNYKTLKKYIEIHNIDVSHFRKQGYNLMPINNHKKTSDILINGSFYPSNKLRKRLINENYLEKKCHKCGLTEWLGLPITLELEHIDGNNTNNLLSNLTLLCPNCHSQTSTWRGRNIKNGSGKN